MGLRLSEAKDCLVETNNLISKTREASWRVIAILLAIDAYVLKQYLDNGFTDLIISCFLLSLIFSAYILFNLKNAMFANPIFTNGYEPNETREHEGKALEETLCESYQEKISGPNILLSKITKGYKSGIESLLLFLLIICRALKKNWLSIY